MGSQENIRLLAGELHYFKMASVDGQHIFGSINVRRLNVYTDVVDASSRLALFRGYISNPTYIVILCDTMHLVRAHKFIPVKQLKRLSDLHGIRAFNENKNTLIRNLETHECEGCRPVFTVLRFRSTGRSGVDVRFIEDRMHVDILPSCQNDDAPFSRDPLGAAQLPDGDLGLEDTSHLTPPSGDQTRRIIKEWREALAPSVLRQSPCSVCSRLFPVSELREIHPDSVDLTLLRNDDVPENLMPQDYNVELYSGALLCRGGLRSPDSVGELDMCRHCHGDLGRGRMPKFALANHLYYAKQRLPRDVFDAFENSTCFERGLVSRARSNSICCRIPIPDEPQSDEGRTSSIFFKVKRGIRGNVIVAPLDSMRLFETLPPPVDEVRDIFCAVLVATKVPDRKTIEKLHPILASRSRVEVMLRFLLGYNPHYRSVDGFRGISTENLNALFDSSSADGLPPSVQIGILPSDPALEAANAGFTTCNLATSDGREVEGVLMENVGFTVSDETPMDYRQMKMQALFRCLTGRPFILSSSGNRVVPDFNNPYLLSWLFPHLDPWGLGGFHHPKRRRKLTLQEQVCHLLQCSDRSFQRDPEFAFVVYNIIRKMNVVSSLSFSAPLNAYQTIVRDILSLDREDVVALAQRFKSDPMYVPQSDGEKAVMKVLGSVGPIARKVPGSIGYKLSKRNEIRALINFRGAPVLFATINPSDIHNPLVSVLAGRDVPDNDILEQMGDEGWERASTAARNPAACAKFFDLLISKFVSIILRYGRGEEGVYGRCEAYYGMVEAQGRGTLHCHILIWLAGHLQPHVLKQALQSIPSYGESLRTWINAVIQSGFIGPNAESALERERLRGAQRDVGMPHVHPGMMITPPFELMPDSEFAVCYTRFVNDLLTEYNIHRHNATCWKYLKRGEKREPHNCRLGMVGVSRPDVSIDPETGEITPSQVHPHMSPFTAICTALLQCNYNVKFAGSGDAANSFLHYVTDYTAKPTLSMHAGLAALSYAIRRMHERIPDVESADQEAFLRAITIAVNSMMGQQEISHQQVMSYLVGGGDCYSNERFQTINWGEVVREVSVQWDEKESGFPEPEHTHNKGGNVCLLPSRGSITIANSLLDYLFRPRSGGFNEMCLYHFVSSTAKEKIPVDRIGAPSLHRRHFPFDVEHPQSDTHAMVMRALYVVPVLLGPRIPLRSSVDGENERWARDVLSLFKPWRHPRELKSHSETWVKAFESFSLQIPARWLVVISNMNVLALGREIARRERATGKHKIFLGELASDIFDRQVAYEQNAFNHLEGSTSEMEKGDLIGLSTVLGEECVSMMDMCYPEQFHHPVEGWVRHITAETAMQISQEIKHMTSMPSQAPLSSAPAETAQGGDRRSFPDIPPSSGIQTLQDRHPFGFNVTADSDPRHAIVNDVSTMFGMAGNAEQMQAFSIIADHILGGGSQLLMYIGGAGGTGKSYVVRAIVDLLHRLGRRRELLMGAPTGIAAVLIGGQTLHSLGMINQGKKSKVSEKLQDLWRGVRYLIIDEISMVGAGFFADFSAQLSIAKGEDPGSDGTLFGGVSVICLGDFCQLKSPMQQSLYSYRLRERPSFDQGGTNEGIGEMSGSYLWQKFDVVVYLKQNQRQSGDPLFASVLGYVGMGSARKAEMEGFKPNGMSIYDYLLTRELASVAATDPTSLGKFWDAPVVVGSKILRDRINARLIRYHARRLGETYHLYCSVDTCRACPISEELQEDLWKLPSRKTKDMLGMLPLFVGMKVMIVENVAIASRAVNGAEGVVRRVLFRMDSSGRRFAEAVYVQLSGSDVQIPGLERGVVVLEPSLVTIKHKADIRTGATMDKFNRKQIPLVPSYSYTDYKSQGRSLSRVIVDLVSARGQGVYVMLSRVKTLDGLLILRWFQPTKVYAAMSADLRCEMNRLQILDRRTRLQYEAWRTGRSRCPISAGE